MVLGSCVSVSYRAPPYFGHDNDNAVSISLHHGNNQTHIESFKRNDQQHITLFVENLHQSSQTGNSQTR